MKGVADSGPLIHLTEIKALWLFSVFEVIYLPDAVWEETVRRGHTDFGVQGVPCTGTRARYALHSRDYLFCTINVI